MKKQVPVSIALFIRNVTEAGFDLWMQKRVDPGSILDGKFEFPGGKIELHETPLQAMKREVLEEVGYKIQHQHLKEFRIYPYEYGEKIVCLFPFIILNEDLPLEKGEWFHVSYKEKSKSLIHLIPQANIPLIDDVCSYINELNHFKVLSFLWK